MVRCHCTKYIANEVQTALSKVQWPTFFIKIYIKKKPL